MFLNIFDYFVFDLTENSSSSEVVCENKGC